MKFQFKLPSISKDKNELNLSHSHTLTHNFGVHQIISAIDVIPNSDITVDLSAFTRLDPLPCPTYGGVKLTHRAYFVPFEFCLRHFNDFVGFQNVPGGEIDIASQSFSKFKMPTFDVFEVFNCLCGVDVSELDSLPTNTDYMTFTLDSSVRYDYVLGSVDFTFYGILTNKGRRIVSWLSQLGYKLPPSSFIKYQGQYVNVFKSYSADALFAFWKYYLDWVVPSRFVFQVDTFVYIKNILDNLDTTEYHSLFFDSNYEDGALALSPFILNVPTSFLDDDPYTVAFQEAYGVENSGSVIGLVDGLQYSRSAEDQSKLNAGYTSVPQHLNANAGSPFSEFALLSLGRLQQLVNKKKITSTKVLDFLRSSFGIAPSHDAMRLSTYLGDFESQIMIGDVMATATTDSQLGTTVVGQYAGKGLGGSTGKWRLRSDCHGILFITSEISTKSSYVNGVSPLRSRTQPLDFFNELFDNVGVRAVRHDELIFNDYDKFVPQNVNYPRPESIFGFHPRYSEYKFKNDEVSGDYLFPSVNEGLDSWYLSRKFKYDDNLKIGLEFCSATSDSVGSQYDRIFQNTDDVDHFNSVYHVDIHETSIKEKFFDYFETINDTSEDKHSQEVNIN